VEPKQLLEKVAQNCFGTTFGKGYFGFTLPLFKKVVQNVWLNLF